MDKRQQITGGFFLILLLIIIFEWIGMGMIKNSFDIEGKKKIISRDIKNLVEHFPVESMIENPDKINRELNRNFNELQIEKEILSSNNQKFINLIKEYVENSVNNDFNFMQFDSDINKMMKEKGYDFKMGLPRQKEEEIREYATNDQSTRIRRIKIVYQPVEYSIENADFERFGEFLDEILNGETFILLGDITIDRVEVNDGRVNVNMELIILKDILGKTKDKEVGLI